jgi:excisionase family DNA binding protein
VCDDRAATSLAPRRLQDGGDVTVTIDGEDLVALSSTGHAVAEDAVLDGADACCVPFVPHPVERTSTPVPCPSTSLANTVVATDNPLTRAEEGMEQPSLFDTEPLLLTIPEAARMLAIGRTLAYELIAAGELEVVHINRAARVPLDAVHAFVERRRAGDGVGVSR